jgi:hypothetical protein
MRCRGTNFFEPDNFYSRRQGIRAFISVTRHVSTQGAFKKSVESHFDRMEIVTRIGFQEAATGQRINFSVMYIKRYAAQPISPPLSIGAHAFSGS